MTELSVRSNYTSHRDGNSDADTAIVFIHGISAGAWCFTNIAQRFIGATSSLCTYRIDLPCHGTRKNTGEAMTLTRYIDAARELIQKVIKKHSRVYILGHSMGGLIAQVLGAELKTHGLILVAPAPTKNIKFDGYDLLSFAKTIVGAGKLTLEGEYDLVRNHIAQFFADPRDPVIDTWIRERIYDPVRLVARIRFSPPVMALPDTHRALVIVPTRDIVIKPSTQHRIASAIAGRVTATHLSEIPLSHMLIMEKGWEQVADVILNWIHQK